MRTDLIFTSAGGRMGVRLTGPNRCPHCAIAKPGLLNVWSSDGPIARTDGGKPIHWGCYKCTACGSIVTATGIVTGSEFTIKEIFPSPKFAHQDIPEPARTFLQQAYDTMHAPDAAAVMAGSAVDAMLKARNYDKGSLYDRIDQALTDNLLTQGMADWAHEVRLGSNRPRHADKDNPHVSPAQAAQSVEFAEALGNFLFVLTARIDRGIAAAKQDAPKTITKGKSG